MFTNQPPPSTYIRAELSDLVKNYGKTDDRCKNLYDFLIDHQPLRYLQDEINKGENGFTIQQLYESRLSLPLPIQSSIVDCFRLDFLWNDLAMAKKSAKVPMTSKDIDFIHGKETLIRDILLSYYGSLIQYRMSADDWTTFWSSAYSDYYGMKKLPKTLKEILGFRKLSGSNEHVMMLIDTVFVPVFPKGLIYAPKNQLYTCEQILENVLYFLYSEPTI